MVEIITHPLIITASLIVGLLAIALIIAEKQDNRKPPQSHK